MSPVLEDRTVSCSIQTEAPALHCALCFARENPSQVVSDHGYSKKDGPTTSTPKKSVKHSVHSSDEELDLDETISPMKSDKNDQSFRLSDYSDDSPVPSPVQNEKQDPVPNEVVSDSKFIVLMNCLLSLFKLIVCRACQSPIDYDDIKTFLMAHV